VAAITSASKAPKGSFYNHFESKVVFGAAIVDEYFDEISTEMQRLQRQSRRPARQRLVGYFQSLRASGRRDGFGRGCLIGNLNAELGASEETIRVRLAAAYREWSQALAVTVEAGQVEGDVRATSMLSSWRRR
jgi:TetR/AcrR family transcriptional repressor of nem operon